MGSAKNEQTRSDIGNQSHSWPAGQGGATGREVSKDLSRVVEAGQLSVDAIERDSVEAAFVKELHTDFEDAKDVQRALFPPQSLAIPGLSIETFYQPAHCIRGDYYDLLPLPSGRWGIAIGDVSGKGVGAALLMASLRASLRAQAMHPHSDPSTLIGCVNRIIYESSPPHCFASLFYAEYEPGTRLLKYVNAGHNPPVVVRSASGLVDLFHLNSANVPVGVAADSLFSTMTFPLQTDDVLVAYTDGITEVENRQGQLWGELRLENSLRICSGLTTEQVIGGILAELSGFADGQAQRDDMTSYGREGSADAEVFGHNSRS